MLKAIAMAFESLSDPKVQRLLIKVVLLTLAVFVVLGFAMWWVLGWVLALVGLTADANMLAALAAFASTVFSSLLLFRIIAVSITWIFSDEIIDAVEQKHYPQQAMLGKRPNIVSGMGMALRSIARVIGYNLLALPLYVILFFTGVGLPIAFLFVNALLLGRDLEDMLIARHGKSDGALGKAPRFMLGLAGTGAMLIPFVNLVVPVIATAAAVHLVHGAARRGASVA